MGRARSVECNVYQRAAEVGVTKTRVWAHMIRINVFSKKLKKGASNRKYYESNREDILKQQHEYKRGYREARAL